MYTWLDAQVSHFDASHLHSEKDIIYVNHNDPYKDRGFEVFAFHKIADFNSIPHLVTQMEIAFDSIDLRDFDDVYKRYPPRLVCAGNALFMYVPLSKRHMLVERPDVIAVKAAAVAQKSATAYHGIIFDCAVKSKAMATNILDAGNGLLLRPMLFVFEDDVTCSGNLLSKDFPTKDQKIKVYLEPLKVKTKAKSGSAEIETDLCIGYVRLNVVSIAPKPLMISNSDEHSCDDAFKGCD